jgi:hypothetical protein
MPLWVPDKTGRFVLRPKYLASEIEQICDDAITDLLTKRHGTVRPPITDDDLCVLAESLGADVHLDADLSGTAGWLQGYTEFPQGCAPRVHIARILNENERHANRRRSTLAHEVGHLLLLGEPYKRPGNVRSGGGVSRHCSVHDWAEWQADHCIGALLMPLSLLEQLIGTRPDVISGLRHPSLSPQGRILTARVARAFAVSIDAARVRLVRVGYLRQLSNRQLVFAFAGVQEEAAEA